MRNKITTEDLINRLPKEEADQLRREIDEEVAKIRGGARVGAGRKCVADAAKNRTIRLNDAEYELFLKKGGGKWLRQELRTGTQN